MGYRNNSDNKTLPNNGTKNLKWFVDQADQTDLEEGRLAYHRYNQMMAMFADEYNLPIERVTAAFCALSPNNDYMGNLRSLKTVIEGFLNGIHEEEITITTYKHCRTRAINYLNGEPFATKRRGLKTLSFYYNILMPKDRDYVTIDGHMVAAYVNEPTLVMKDVSLTKSEYMMIDRATKRLAGKIGLIPNQLQAIIWFTRKRIYGIKYNPNVGLFDDPTDKWKTLIPMNEIPLIERAL